MSASGQRHSFFGDSQLDVSLPAANALFWAALLGHIDAEGGRAPSTILDLGCHSGGLLTLLGERFPEAQLIGIEPVAALRSKAEARLEAHPGRATIRADWAGLRENSVDLFVCHETLYLIPDLVAVMESVARSLARGATGWVVLGCHPENPVWTVWKALLAADGIETYDHLPFDILAAAARAGLVADVQPLRRAGWIRYDPTAAAFPFPDASAMLDHHYRHKLLFRLRLDQDDAASPS